jgi:hypothetical protein
MQLSQPLSEDGIVRCYSSAREYRGLLEDSPRVLNVVLFPIETHFPLDGYINKQRIQFRALENPGFTFANPMLPEGITVWCAFSSIRTFGPIFINGAVTCDVYVSMLSDALALS